MEVLSNQVDQACHKREAGDQEQQCGNKARLVRRLNAEEMLCRGDQKDVDHGGERAARHPHTEVVHVPHEHLATQRLTKERGHGDGRAFDPSPTVQKGERRTREARGERIREPVVEAGDLRDLIELIGDILDAHGLAVKRGDVVVNPVDLVRVDTHEALFSELGAEGTVRVSGGNDLGVRHLGAMLGNTHRSRDVRHGLLDAVGARSKGQQHLPESEHNLGLMSEAIMGRHTLSKNLVLPTVSVGRVWLMCRSDHGNSIARLMPFCGRRWSVSVFFHLVDTRALEDPSQTRPGHSHARRYTTGIRT